MIELPEKINIRIIDSIKNCPIKGIAVIIQIFSNQKNDYYMIPQLSNVNGEIAVSKDWVNNEINKVKNMNFIDYNSTIYESRPFIKVKIMNNEEINQTIKSMIEWQNVFEEEIYNLKIAKNPLYLPVTKTIYFDNEDLLEIDIETKGILIYSNNFDLNKCSDIVREFIKKENISCTEDELILIAKDIMNTSYSRGGDYSNNAIKSIANDYFENKLYTKFLSSSK